MRTILLNMLLIIAFFGSAQLHARDCSTLLDVDVKTLNKNRVINLCDEYQGKVLLVVNTASKCAYTNQYESLEKLYKKYQAKGLVVLGFPSNDFANQEPGTEKEIKDFCSVTYGVEFPMFSKAHVMQRNADPFYRKLAEASGSYPKWNFHKYLIGSDGLLVSNYPSAIDPLNRTIIDVIETELKKISLIQ